MRRWTRSEIHKSGVLWKCTCEDCIKAMPDRAMLRVMAKEIAMSDVNLRQVGAYGMSKEEYLAHVGARDT